ncbi:hypothetical protein [Azohydromonas sp.]|uniref:hypothetical protein n=1 Tax=Azohydromonas sp. TaxID=1872666 RepID=UPI002CD43960|nr:hypothetical protein [Azohydromonas sp.]HMM87069.1 hypothetical protein [Azohydromonas sp.]
MSVPERNGFAVALAAALRARDMAAIERVVKLYSGSRVYLPRRLVHTRTAGAAALARGLVDAGVGTRVAQAMVRERFELSPRHARRLVRAAVDMRGQRVAASCTTIVAKEPSP